MDCMPDTKVTVWLAQLQYISTYIYKFEEVFEMIAKKNMTSMF